MNAKEIIPGLRVCILVKGAPFCNTVVSQYPIPGKISKDLCLLKGVDEPFPIKELKPFTTGVISK